MIEVNPLLDQNFFHKLQSRADREEVVVEIILTSYSPQVSLFIHPRGAVSFNAIDSEISRID